MLSELMYLARHPRYFLKIARDAQRSPEYTCSNCNFIGRFGPAGSPPRFAVRCPNCRSLERHRLFALCLERSSIVHEGERVLHFAPEPTIREMLPKEIDYVSADIQPGRADMVLNLEAIDLAEETVDVVVANHVLEHVDDRRALTELYRILRPGGRLILTVPIVEGWDWTYENPAISTPAGRIAHFGQDDHVRYYGRDLRGRVSDAGFDLSEFVASGEECVRYRLARGGRIFIAAKPHAAAPTSH